MNNLAAIISGILFRSQCHSFRNSHREPRYRGRVHAIRAQVWQGSDLVNEIEGEHCIGMTPGDVIHYVEAMLVLLKEVYDISYFADIEQLDPDYCPIRPCPRHSARFVQLQS